MRIVQQCLMKTSLTKKNMLYQGSIYDPSVTYICRPGKSREIIPLKSGEIIPLKSGEIIPFKSGEIIPLKFQDQSNVESYTGEYPAASPLLDQNCIQSGGKFFLSRLNAFNLLI